MAHGHMEGETYVKHEKEKDKLRMAGGAWTVNMDELPFEARDIKYVSENQVYTISQRDALDYGFRRVLGGESKLVVPIEYWTKENK